MNKLLNIGVFLLFASSALYMTDLYRLNVGLTVSINMIILVVLAVYYLATQPVQLLKYSEKDSVLFKMLGGLMFVFLVGIYYASDIGVGLKYFVKLFTTILFFLCVYFISRNVTVHKHVVKKGINVLLVTSSLILVGLIVLNFLVYHNNYLTFNYSSGSGLGKNQIQLYLSLMFPLVVYKVIYRRKMLWIAVLLVHFASVILVGSRGLLVALSGGFFLALFIDNSNKIVIPYYWRKPLVKSTMVFFIVLFVSIIGMFTVSERFTEKMSKTIEYSVVKMIELVDAVDGGTESNSINERKYFLNHGLEMFAESPVLGNGLGGFQSSNVHKKVTHNDYLFFLTDTGLLGFLNYLSIIVLSILLIRKKGHSSFFLMPFFVDLLFINAFLFPLFWFLLALFLTNKKELIV
jgi:O-antigen ligase